MTDSNEHIFVDEKGVNYDHSEIIFNNAFLSRIPLCWRRFYCASEKVTFSFPLRIETISNQSVPVCGYFIITPQYPLIMNCFPFGK